MDEPGFKADFLSASRVAIWGLGLMGGSLALALKDHCVGMVGIDRDPATLALARQMGVVERAVSVDALLAQPQNVLAEIDVLILATPVRSILTILQALPDLCPRPLVVMDLGSTKAQITEAMAGLPERFEAVGGHPMCGKEKSSLAHAEAAIYQSAPFALVAAGERTTPHARELAEAVARAVKARLMWLEAGEHDRWVAATSHTPFLIASALAKATPPEAAPLIGPGFRSTARLAGSSSEMMLDILATNAENIRAMLKTVRLQIQQYEDLLASGDLAALADQLHSAGQAYQALTQTAHEPQRIVTR